MEKSHKLGLKLSLFLALCYGIRLYLASYFPLTNDEAYYVTWSKDLQWGYLDHPPGVAYLIFLSRHLFDGYLGVRFLGIVLHLIASFFLVASLRIVDPHIPKKEVHLLWILLQIIPIFSLWGMFALPDTGLYFGLSLCLYANLRIYKDGLTLPRSILLGLGLGIAGVFKYHALPVAGGMTLWLIFRPQLWLKLIPGILVAGSLVAPVFIWNALNDWASFRFQTAHGFEIQKSFSPRYFFQVRLGELFFLTPVLYILSFLAIFRAGTYKVIFAGGFLPLVGLLFYSSIWKQNLPHWIMPSFWIMLVLVVALHSTILLRQLRYLYAYAIVVVVLLTTLSQPILKETLLKSLQGEPGALSELTLWPYLADELKNDSSFVELQDLNIASTSWFAAAQLGYELNRYVYSTSSKTSFIKTPQSPYLLVAPKPIGSYHDNFIKEIRPKFHESTPFFVYLIQ
jgi:4-amino-4-deoxy-L-arabinose transferase-like glycosyltransferase